ncbi:MAG: hypothetical protein WAK66_10790, partial [Methylocystis sp.]
LARERFGDPFYRLSRVAQIDGAIWRGELFAFVIEIIWRGALNKKRRDSRRLSVRLDFVGGKEMSRRHERPPRNKL